MNNKSHLQHVTRICVLLLLLLECIATVIIARHVKDLKHNENEPIQQQTTTEISQEAKPQSTQAPQVPQSTLHNGMFTVSHYCGCECCCGQYSDGYEDIAYGCRGDKLTAYISIAADPEVLPYGTVCWDSAGNIYVVQDVGGSIDGNKIDVFVGNHTEALNLGVQTVELFWEEVIK